MTVHGGGGRTCQLLCPTTRLMQVSMLPDIANTRPGRRWDRILAACKVGKVCPECEMHNAVVCLLSRARFSLQAQGSKNDYLVRQGGGAHRKL